MNAMASRITGVSTVCPTVCSGADQRKHQSPASLAFVRGIYRWPMVSPHKEPVKQKKLPFDHVILIMTTSQILWPILTLAVQPRSPAHKTSSGGSQRHQPQGKPTCSPMDVFPGLWAGTRGLQGWRSRLSCHKDDPARLPEPWSPRCPRGRRPWSGRPSRPDRGQSQSKEKNYWFGHVINLCQGHCFSRQNRGCNALS